MRILLALSVFFAYDLLAQVDTTASWKLIIETAPSKYATRDSSNFIDVCRNDTMWLYDWQYDSTLYYRKRSSGMTIWGTGPTADTLIRFEKADSFPSDFHGWLHDWMIQHRNCSYNMIYYNTGELHMIFQDYGEGHYGEFKEYHKNGKLKCIGGYCQYEVGLRNGEWKWYDDQGKLIEIKNYNCGRYCSDKDRHRPRIFYPPRLKFDY